MDIGSQVANLDINGVLGMVDIHYQVRVRLCDAAADFGAAYDSEWSREEQYRGWLRMWFMGAAAFEDAYRLSEAWVRPSRDLWTKAAEAIAKASRGLAKAHPQEAIDGERIWCAHASPYAHPELEEWITNG